MCGMPGRRTIPRRPPAPDITAVMQEYLLDRSMNERASFHADRLKKQLMTVLEQEGEEDTDGHRHLDLPSPLEYTEYKTGKPKLKIVTGIDRKKRTTQSLNEERTMAALKERELLDRCTEVIVVIDEDAVIGANYEGLIPDDVMEKLYEKTENYAFYLATEEP